MEQSLTPEQNRVADKRGLVTVIACPGAGKTRLVAARFARLEQELSLNEYQGVAALSFTHTAVKEIRAEFRRLTKKLIDEPHFIGTIDSFIARYIYLPFGHLVLGNHSKRAGLIEPDSPFLNTRYRSYPFANLNKAKKLQEYRYIANGSITPQGSLHQDVLRMKEDMKRLNLSTISDSSYWALIVLKKYPIITKALLMRFPFIMIDEAQDLSDVQMAIVDILVLTGHKEIMLLGDPYQAIYEFRHAEPLLLVEKSQNTTWDVDTIDSSFRCRENIGNLLNCCHSEDLNRTIVPIHKEPDNIEFLDEISPDKIVEEFCTKADKVGIIRGKDNLALLYGAHDSVVSPKRVTEQSIAEYFSSKDRTLHSLLALALREFEVQDFERSLIRILRFSFFLQHGHYPHTSTELENDPLYSVSSRAFIWIFFKSLPNSDVTLQEWVNLVNVKLHELYEFIEYSGDFEINLNKQKKQDYSRKLSELFYDNGFKDCCRDVLVTNLHQVKGKTFEGVAIYLEDGNLKMISQGRLLKLLNGVKKFEKLNEYDRCLYVAISRPKKLLCFAGSTDDLKKWWQERQNEHKVIKL